jgi:hypothetical protein
LSPSADEGLVDIDNDATAGPVDVAADPIPAVCERTGRLVLATLHDAGGIRRLAADHETVSAHHGNNHAPLMERFYRSHRPVLFALLDALELQPTSADRTVLDAVAFLKANRHRIGELVSDHQADGTPLDLSFASAWIHRCGNGMMLAPIMRKAL